jgi:hypothetical protein
VAELTRAAAAPRPGAVARQLLGSLDAADGRRRRRQRDTTPDALGLGLKRELLERLADADPAPARLEAWLLDVALAASASGPMRAVCAEVLDDYRLAQADGRFARWLADGAPSADAAGG